MGELVDRNLQHDLLMFARNDYPAYAAVMHFATSDSSAFKVNAAYLEEHGLIMIHSDNPIPRGGTILGIKITAKGIDFLADDGGLTAILGVVTVKLHSDTIKSLLIEKVQASDASQSVKEKVIDQIKSLPAEATKETFLAAAKAGIDAVPDIINWFSRWGG